MINTEYFKNKKITIVGLARSGAACANLLCDLGARVSITDKEDSAITRANSDKLRGRGINIELGRHSSDFIKDKDLVVVSPGVSNSSLPLLWAKENNIPAVSEIEIGFRLCPAPIIAVTGSNGKTTVTTLIGRILEAGGRKAFVCGNIGNPFCAEVSKVGDSGFVSLEVSSFQLETIEKFKPKVAVVLNFSRNHLDRYKNMQEYLDAKRRIFKNQDKDDYLVLNHHDKQVRALAQEAKSNAVYFSNTRDLNLNQAAVIAVGSILGIDKNTCLEVFRAFKGIEHRMEYVARIDNVKFINDSKSTTVDSTIWALENIADPVILITGGRDKGNDYSLILDLARKKVKEVILIGEAKEKMKNAFRGSFPVNEASTLEEAVSLALCKARPGDCALLSPMCSSFDMFSNYEERGEKFKEAVHNLITDNRQLRTDH